MTLEQLKADHPELVEAITAEATAGHAEALAAARLEGAAAELQRIKDVKAQAIPGHEALVEQLAMDGTSTAATAALAIVAAEKQQGAAAAAALDADANPPVAGVATETGAEGKTIKRPDFDALDQAARRSFLAAGGKIID